MVVVAFAVHDRLATPPFKLTDTQYKQRSGKDSNRHDALKTAASALLTVGVISVVDTLGGTVR
jgi:hypothetical protein